MRKSATEFRYEMAVCAPSPACERRAQACSDSGEWMISIEPDSSTKILSCATIKQLGDDCHAVWNE